MALLINGKVIADLKIVKPKPPADAPLTWHRMKALQPRLEDLEQDIREERKRLVSLHLLGIHKSPDKAWHDFDWDRVPIKESFKARMSCLVGTASDVPELQSSEAYDLAFNFLYGLLSGKKNWEGQEWKADRERWERIKKRRTKK